MFTLEMLFVRLAVVGRSTWTLAWIGAMLGMAMACIALAPAVWLGYAVARVSNGYVHLLNTEGSLWNGSAVLALAAGTHGTHGTQMQAMPSRMHWRILPQWMGASAYITADCCLRQPLKLQLDLAEVRLSAAEVQVPLALLEGWGAPWNTLGLQGQARAQWEMLNFSWGNDAHLFDGTAELLVNSMSTRLSTLPHVGSYRVVFSGGEQPMLDVSTLQGALQLSGSGRWKQRRFHFDGEGVALPESAAALINVLTLIGEQRGSVTKIRWGDT